MPQPMPMPSYACAPTLNTGECPLSGATYPPPTNNYSFTSSNYHPPSGPSFPQSQSPGALPKNSGHHDGKGLYRGFSYTQHNNHPVSQGFNKQAKVLF